MFMKLKTYGFTFIQRLSFDQSVFVYFYYNKMQIELFCKSIPINS